MIPVYSSPSVHLANARTVVNGLIEGYLGYDTLEILRVMVMDIREAVYRSGGAILVDAWLGQVTAMLDCVIYGGRAMDDLDLKAVKDCLAEGACLLRACPDEDRR